MKRLSKKELTFKEFCQETYGYDPTTPDGEMEFIDLHQPELEAVEREYPNKDDDFYIKKVINDLVINEYYDLANYRGFEPIMDGTIPSGGVILNKLHKRRKLKTPTNNKLLISIITDED